MSITKIKMLPSTNLVKEMIDLLMLLDDNSNCSWLQLCMDQISDSFRQHQHHSPY